MSTPPTWSGATPATGSVADRAASPTVVARDPVVHWRGTIHNGDALRQQLGLPPHTPLAQVLSNAWARWGLASFSRIDGVFSLAVQDGDDTVLYRDPSGLRDLLIAEEPGRAPRHALHLAHLQSPGQTGWPVDRASVQAYLRFLEVAPPHTWKRGVTALPAGHIARWSATSSVRIDAAPDSVPAEPVPTSFEAAVDAVDRQLQAAVQGHLAGAQTPGAFLSSGVDSALLCALAARLRPDLRTVTVGFAGERYDETPVAQRIARHLGLAHDSLRFNRQQLLSAFDRLSREASQPMADPAAMATVLAFEHCQRHHDRVLDGTGADEAVGLMPPRHVRVAVAHASRLPPVLRRGLAAGLQRLPWLRSYTPIFDFDHPADTMSRWHGFNRAEIQDLCRAPDALARAQFYQVFARHPRDAHFERYSELMDTLTCDRLNAALWLTEAPVRFPFWDHALHRYLRRLPVSYRHMPGLPKRILRSVLARHLPPALWDQPKHSFDFPLQSFLAEDDHALVREHLDRARWRAHGLLDPAAVAHYAQRFLAGDARITFRIWALVVLGAWLTQHHDQLDTAA